MGIVKRIKDAAYNAYDTASNALAGAELSGMAARGLGKINAIRRSPAGKAIERAARSPRGRAVGSLVKRSGRVSLGALALELLGPVALDAARSASRSLAERTMGKTSYSGYRDSANGFDADNPQWRQKMRRSANARGYEYGGVAVGKGRPKMQRSGSLQKLPLLPGNRGSLRNMPDTEFGKRYARRAIDRPAGKSKPSDYFEIPVRKSVKPLGFMCGGKVPSRRGR